MMKQAIALSRCILSEFQVSGVADGFIFVKRESNASCYHFLKSTAAFSPLTITPSSFIAYYYFFELARLSSFDYFSCFWGPNCMLQNMGAHSWHPRKRPVTELAQRVLGPYSISTDAEMTNFNKIYKDMIQLYPLWIQCGILVDNDLSISKK
jgi:hypothetical protein